MGGDDKTIGLGGEAHNQAGSGLVVGKVARMCGLAGAFDPAAILCGSELARDENDAIPEKTNRLYRRRAILLQPQPTPHHQPTHPCAFAYNYARIRPLVRLVPGLYRFLATAHQWSGLVARFTPRLYKSHQSGICLFLMVAVRMAPSGAPVLV
ncbi:hypothetical protein AO356_11215 [Pseudomonas fluorescens]|uniref:Uncharacterized protein n=2 Tax=Pseudomonas TaxID=286 RepID=A0A0N9W7C7_PSEFL|nr:hypothetical protein AO356_11215 [Pseudomonas fluorescens]